ncbi:protein FAM83D isoform X1 [Hypanus sabinus]|uniref:protein FAM83D isoform X1 n=1 Tax=Hypanus sabinus TaxID=79690 RepID=UPI0028C465F3|nr:protein FAM83D isoform X1 [Hypanus sabinus]
MNDSQCLDDFPVVSRWTAAAKQEVGVRDFYSESQRLALEELVAGGPEAYRAFLHREKMPGFLSADEIADILGSAVRPSELCGESLDQSFCDSQGTGTYFPDVSDVAVPDLELGWPVFPHNWYRGMTQVEVYFQPSYGELIYSCKEAIRNLIRKAEKVIALVMDSFTDIDILQDLHEVSRRKRIPVYILLDESGLPQFQQMCRDAGVWVEEERKMRVRTLKGCTYYTRKGAKVIGKVHEKFMLIDCEKVATGSYSFTWTDGKLNRSNLTVLSGQLSEYYDEEFRILYAQSEPIPPGYISYSNREKLALDRLQSKNPPVANALRLETVERSPDKREPAEKRPRLQSAVHSMEQCRCEASTQAGDALPVNKEVKSVSTQTELEWVSVPGTFTQACASVKEMETQTSFFSKPSAALTPTATRVVKRAQIIASSVQESPTEVTGRESTDSTDQPSASTTESTNSSSTLSGNSISESCPKAARYPYMDLYCADSSSLKDTFHKLTTERQLHYSTVRSKLNNMVAILSRTRHPDVIHSQGQGQYIMRDKRELMSRVFRFRDAPVLSSFALRN